MEILKTKRLSLRTFTENDAAVLLPILSDKEVMRFSMTGVMTKEQVKGAVKDWIKARQAKST